MTSVTDPSSAPGHRSAGLLMLVLLAGCAALVMAGHANDSTPREACSAAAWQLATWSHNPTSQTIGQDSVAEGGFEPGLSKGASADARGGLHREHAFGFAPGSRTLSRRLNLPPPAC